LHGNLITARLRSIANQALKDYLFAMNKKVATTAAPGNSRSTGRATGSLVQKHGTSIMAGKFQAVANTLKPMSKQGSISMAQARKAVQDYVRSTSK
jgi:hypothetical protein